ncbi:MAG TPA: PH domain-containing protein [Candidatus Thermoplasmatota archaeon]|nr:PH domain-containing protein [Candidatus Thermoplasmatota archaeon]
MAAREVVPAPGLDALGRFVNRREIASLKPVLGEGERLLYAVEGHARDRRGLLAATDLRVLFVSKGWIRTKVDDFPYEDLKELAVSLDRDDAVVTLRGGDRELVVAKADKLGAQELGERANDAARLRKSSFRLVRADPNAPTVTSRMKAAEERLERLDRMLARRSMTAAEHRVARRRILEEMGLPTDLPDAEGRVSQGGRVAVRGDPETALKGEPKKEKTSVKRF